jgi:hypothetical protein
MMTLPAIYCPTSGGWRGIRRWDDERLDAFVIELDPCRSILERLVDAEPLP